MTPANVISTLLRVLLMSSIPLIANMASAQTRVVVIPMGGAEATGNAVASDVRIGKTFSNGSEVNIDGTLIPTLLLKTGVTGCVGLSGGVTTCNALFSADVGQDGFVQAGEDVASRWETLVGVVVHDKATGLIWERTPTTSTLSYLGARDHCTDLVVPSTAGISISGWRLPNIRELMSLVDYGEYAPSLDPTAFLMGNINSQIGFWSNTPNVATAENNNSWVLRTVNFFDGTELSANYQGSARVWCVK